jgi:hypothetical protein
LLKSWAMPPAMPLRLWRGFRMSYAKSLKECIYCEVIAVISEMLERATRTLEG